MTAADVAGGAAVRLSCFEASHVGLAHSEAGALLLLRGPSHLLNAASCVYEASKNLSNRCSTLTLISFGK